MTDPIVEPDDQTFPKMVRPKARVMFCMSLLLSLLITVILVIAVRRGGLFSPWFFAFLLGVLFWSFVVSGYAFELVWSVSRRAEKALFMDPRTGVFSLEYLKSALHRDYKRAIASGVGSIVIYVDMFGLQNVNRNIGYTVGDIALKSVAGIISDAIRSSDIVGRVGGDEFLIVMPEATLDLGEAIARKVRQAVGSYQLDLGKRGRIDSIGCHTGIAVFPADGTTPQEIISAARNNITESQG
ncbi:MAG: GGDEF domain-containing protein [Planctomycetes bacterium]|nr:GGDEF domain-containing protein [Planctomycetota bacterium]